MKPSRSSPFASPRRSTFSPTSGLFSSSKHARKKLYRLVGLAVGLIVGVYFGLGLLRTGGGEVEEMSKSPPRPKLAPHAPTRNIEQEQILKGGKVGLEVGTTFVDPRPGPYELHPSRPEDEKYLAYLPHSGYHNQRIALTNALVLAHHLNRTLLLPPLILGTPVPKREPNSHHKQLLNLVSSRTRLADVCPALFTSGETSTECEGWGDRSLVSWDMMVDLKSARKRGANVLEWWSMDESWLEQELGIDPEKDIKKFWTKRRYDYQIYLSTSASEGENEVEQPFQTRLNVDADLAPLEERVLWFGSLFGSRRLVLDGASEEDQEMESGLRRDVALKFGALSSAVQAGRKVLEGGKKRGKQGNGYLGLHLRLNERIFAWDAGRNSRKTFFNLLQTHLGLPLATVTRLDEQTWRKDRRYRELVLAPPTPAEGIVWDGVGPQLSPLDADPRSRPPVEPYPPIPVVDTYTPSPSEATSIPPLALDVISPFPSPAQIHCRRPPHTDPSLLLLNTPLYISTDATDPLTHPALAPFLTHFPCVFFLTDLLPLDMGAVRTLQGLRNKDDGVRLWKFFVPFLDGLIAGGGRRVLGTPKSTFSSYVVEVEWRKAWGLGEKGVGEGVVKAS